MPALTLPPLSSSRSTRVISLLPSTSLNATLKADIEVVDLKKSSHSDYECLSYTWGPPTPSSGPFRSITVDGTSVAIRENLFNALRRLRSKTTSRRLWVDALSISQNDVKEKAQQVQMIAKIFRDATRVLVWVGEHADGSELVLQPSSAAAMGLDQQFIAFTKRPYWNRTWVIQEIACAKDLVLCCGSTVMKWDPFMRRMKEFPNFHTPFYKGSGIIKCLDDNRLPKGKDSTGEHFAALLGIVSRTECFDRRDKIYSVLALDDYFGLSNLLKVDYKVRPTELFLRLMTVVANSEDLSRHKDMGPKWDLVFREALMMKKPEIVAAIAIMEDTNELLFEPVIQRLKDQVVYSEHRKPRNIKQ